MVAIISLLLIVTLSILITRVASIALVHTGLSRESARFQARSAFTGAGFTTSESERVVNHPVRRRIVLLLMLLGNAGIVTAVTSLILGFVDESGRTDLGWKVLLLASGLTVLWRLSASRWVDRQLSTVIEAALRRHSDLEVRDYASLMHLAGDYRLVELNVQEQDWLADKTLAELELNREGVLVLGLQRRDGSYVGAPRGVTGVHVGDTMLVYGRASVIEALDQRRDDWAARDAHLRAVEEQGRVEVEERRRDAEVDSQEGEALKGEAPEDGDAAAGEDRGR
ncbi:MAG: TrkA C-terminal domain-containing protein, partial [Candidatus Eiseniibacteriota bacterium]